MEVARRVAVAVDFSDCSKRALRWAVDNVVRDGDYLILLTVRPSGNYEEGEMQLWETTGSRNSLSLSLSVSLNLFFGSLCFLRNFSSFLFFSFLFFSFFSKKKRSQIIDVMGN